MSNITDDTELFAFMQIDSINDGPAKISEFTTSLSKMRLAYLYSHETMEIRSTMISAISNCEDESLMYHNISKEWDHTMMTKFVDHLNLQDGWTGFESEDFSVCIAISAELAGDGFDTLYPYL